MITELFHFAAICAKFEDLDRLAIFIENEHSDTNILINNAGIQFNYHFAEEHHLLSKIEQEINTNFIAPSQVDFNSATYFKS
jgi:uncharacterized oxidoreductase